jgi:diguanylate cyclase (GGDEF)-like protein
MKKIPSNQLKLGMISQYATVGLIILMSALTLFVLCIGIYIQNTTQDLAIASNRSDAYYQIYQALNQEELHLHDFSLDHAAESWENYQAAARQTAISLQSLQRMDIPTDRTFVKQLFTEYNDYTQNIDQLRISADSGDEKAVNEIYRYHIDVQIEILFKQLSAKKMFYHEQALQSLNTLNSIKILMVTAIPFFVASIILSTMSACILHIYRQKLYRAAKSDIERLTQLAARDNLTGLGNHRDFHEKLQNILKQAQETKETVGLGLIAINELKAVNEELGYLEGDRLLANFADLLRDGGWSKHMFRLSGNLFAVIMENATEDAVAQDIKDLEQAVKQHLPGTTISAGSTITKDGGYDAQILHTQADAALQDAKRHGNHTIVAFNAIREKAGLLQPQKVNALRQLLREKHVNVHFQPVWDMASGKLLSYEALARPAAEYGFAGPQEMFDIAEHIGRAHELDYVCVRAILARAKALPENVLLFINLTPQTLCHDLLTSAVLMTEVISAGLSPQRVVLELTERSIVELPTIIREANKLRELGFQLALDDTGAGNAGLEMLSQLQVDFVKIDRTLVTNALFDKSARGVLTGLRSIAREIGAYVIAEGIENTSMLDLIQYLDIEAVQGYLLGRPGPTFLDEEAQSKLCPAAHLQDQGIAV